MPTILIQVNIISRSASLYRSGRLHDSELGGCHHSYILAICSHPGISGEELAGRICVNKSNVARNLSYLEEHGYVRREQSKEDKRVTLCYPTEKMLGVLPQVRKISEEWNSFVTEDLTEEEKSQLSVLLNKVAAKAREYGEKNKL